VPPDMVRRGQVANCSSRQSSRCWSSDSGSGRPTAKQRCSRVGRPKELDGSSSKPSLGQATRLGGDGSGSAGANGRTIGAWSGSCRPPSAGLGGSSAADDPGPNSAAATLDRGGATRSGDSDSRAVAASNPEPRPAPSLHLGRASAATPARGDGPARSAPVELSAAGSVNVEPAPEASLEPPLLESP